MGDLFLHLIQFMYIHTCTYFIYIYMHLMHKIYTFAYVHTPISICVFRHRHTIYTEAEAPTSVSPPPPTSEIQNILISFAGQDQDLWKKKEQSFHRCVGTGGAHTGMTGFGTWGLQSGALHIQFHQFLMFYLIICERMSHCYYFLIQNTHAISLQQSL